MVKIVTLFLIGVLVLAMFGKLRAPRSIRRTAEKLRLSRVKKCRRCGSPIPGGGRCICEDKT
ncbi:hypothetical protein ACQ5SP_08430 [Rhodovulum sp. YNF3179]|uniref:hypothetical protein n=1 Tax=Rhodovulum sp. YNF3179 TaxID=3425127 RepID=UPI003D350EB4